MTKIIFATRIVFLRFILLSCDRSSKTLRPLTELITTIDSIVSAGHNSFNSLDVEGDYKGTLPCADCEGIKPGINVDRKHPILNSQNTWERVAMVLKRKVFVAGAAKVIV